VCLPLHSPRAVGDSGLSRYLTRTLTSWALFHRSSPSAKRSLKPLPSTASQQQGPQHTAPPELASLKPAVSVATSHQDIAAGVQQSLTSPTNRKRKSVSLQQSQEQMASSAGSAEAQFNHTTGSETVQTDTGAHEPRPKKNRTNTPWTPAEELRLKQMRDAGNSWSEIAKVQNRCWCWIFEVRDPDVADSTPFKTFPLRTEGSVKKHWYKVGASASWSAAEQLT
jgi:hypothetical protein